MANRVACCILCLLALVFLYPSAYAADPPAASAAAVYIDVYSRGTAKVDVVLRGGSPLPPAQVFDAIGRSLGIPAPVGSVKPDGDRIYYYSRASRTFKRHGLVVRGVVDLEPLARLLGTREHRTFRVVVALPDTPYASANITGRVRRERHWIVQRQSFPLHPAKDIPPVRFQFGYRAGDVVAVVVPLALLLVTAPAAILWRRRRALHRLEGDLSSSWFSFQMFFQFATLLAFAAWPLACSALAVDDLCRFALPPLSRTTWTALSTFAYALPIAAVIWGCAYLSHPVLVRLKDTTWTRAEFSTLMLLLYARWWVPIMVLSLVIAALADGSVSGALLWAAAAYVSAQILSRTYASVAGVRREAISTGEIRDRVLALAAQAGVSVNQVHYLTTGKARIANAAAALGGQVLLTDALLNHLERREVDAVIAHELAHLKYRHPLRMVAFIPALAISTVLLRGVLDAVGIGTPYAGAAGTFVLTVAAYLLWVRNMRGYEGVADTNAARWVGDGEALIRGLVRMGRLNRVPVRWPGSMGRLLTHPSTEARAAVLARHGLIDKESIDTLLDDPKPPRDRYVLPEGMQEGFAFSSGFRGTALLVRQWLHRAALVVPVTLAVVLGERGGLEGAALVGAVAGGIAAAVGASYLLERFVPLWGYPRLEARVRAGLARRGCVEDPAAGEFVGVAPGASARAYEFFYDWDYGVLRFDGDALVYRGEKSALTLHRARIRLVYRTADLPGWQRSWRIVIEWDDLATGEPRSMNLRPARLRPGNGNVDARSLLDRLQRWTAEPASPGPERGDECDRIPAPDSVNGVKPGTFWTPVNVAVSIVVFGALAIAASGAASLSLILRPTPGSGWYVVAGVCIALGLVSAPYARRYREEPPAGKV